MSGFQDELRAEVADLKSRLTKVEKFFAGTSGAQDADVLVFATVFDDGNGDVEVNGWQPQAISGDATIDNNGVLTLSGDTGKLELATPDNQDFSGVWRNYTYGESIVPGDILYLSGSETVSKADANASGKFPAMGLALATASSGSHPVLLYGIYRDDTLYNWTPDEIPLWLSTTAGALTATQPSATDDAIQPIAFAEHADRVFFRPDITWLTHV